MTLLGVQLFFTVLTVTCVWPSFTRRTLKIPGNLSRSFHCHLLFGLITCRNRQFALCVARTSLGPSGLLLSPVCRWETRILIMWALIRCLGAQFYILRRTLEWEKGLLEWSISSLSRSNLTFASSTCLLFPQIRCPPALTWTAPMETILESGTLDTLAPLICCSIE